MSEPRSFRSSGSASPEDIANTVAFLAGPDGAWINGQIIWANGRII